MQNNVVKAFRQRLVRGGFEDISIFECNDGTYSVYCKKDRVIFKKRLTLIQMQNIPRLVWFD